MSVARARRPPKAPRRHDQDGDARTCRFARSGTRLPVPLVVGHARLVRKAPRLRGRARGRRRATAPEPRGLRAAALERRAYVHLRRSARVPVLAAIGRAGDGAEHEVHTIERSSASPYALARRRPPEPGGRRSRVRGGQGRHISGIRASGDKPQHHAGRAFQQLPAAHRVAVLLPGALGTPIDPDGLAGFRQRVRTTWRPTYRTRRSCCVAIRTTAVRAAPVRTFSGSRSASARRRPSTGSRPGRWTTRPSSRTPCGAAPAGAVRRFRGEERGAAVHRQADERDRPSHLQYQPAALLPQPGSAAPRATRSTEPPSLEGLFTGLPGQPTDQCPPPSMAGFRGTRGSIPFDRISRGRAGLPARAPLGRSLSAAFRPMPASPRS